LHVDLEYRNVSELVSFQTGEPRRVLKALLTFSICIAICKPSWKENLRYLRFVITITRTS